MIDDSRPLVPAAPQPWRSLATGLAFLLLFAMVIIRLHTLQVDGGDRFQSLGERQRVRDWVLHAPRGQILDATGAPLAAATATWNCLADIDYMDDRLSATVQLSRALGLDRETLRDIFERGGNGRLLARDLDEPTAEAVRALDLAGIHLRRSFARAYPERPVAPHIVGFVLDDGTGGAGIEQAYQSLLAGRDGRQRVVVDARGRPIVGSDIGREPPMPGASIQTTLVPAIQVALEDALAAAVERHRPSSACGIVIRPGTGEIVAMASWPTFDPRSFRSADATAFRNNALTFAYESGSTIKPLIAGAAVTDGLVAWDSRVFCENGRWTIRVGRSSRVLHDHSFKKGGHQWLTVAEGVAKSDNILMAKLGIQLGPDRLHQWVRQLGFGERTSLGLPGEEPGVVFARSRWTVIGSCVSVPIGHELMVTPLQMAMAHAAVANGGLLLPPRLVSRLLLPDVAGGSPRSVDPNEGQQARRVFSAADAAEITAAMRLTMTDGTGRNIQLDGYSSAGKTGTTEKLVNGQYAKDRHIGSFVGFAPASPGVSPELLAIVVVDDPTANGHYGGATAGPVVRSVLQSGLEHLGVPPDQSSSSQVRR